MEGSELRVDRAPAALTGPTAGAALSDRATEAAIRHDEMHARLCGLHDLVDVTESMRRLGIVAGTGIVDVEIIGPRDQHDLLGVVIIGSKILVGKRPVDRDAVFRFQPEVAGMIAGANRPPANGAATERNRVVPILFAGPTRIKLFRIVD